MRSGATARGRYSRKSDPLAGVAGLAPADFEHAEDLQREVLSGRASSRILSRTALKKTTGYIDSSARRGHAVASATTASATALIKSDDPSTAYIAASNV